MPNLADPDLPLPAALTFTPADCSSLEVASAREWLLTDGLGGFAMGTVGGLRTRRYHGLLVAATQPPAGRMMLVNTLEEWVTLNDVRYDLSCHQYPPLRVPLRPALGRQPALREGPGVAAGADVEFKREIFEAFTGHEMAETVGAKRVTHGGPLGLPFLDLPVSG